MITNPSELVSSPWRQAVQRLETQKPKTGFKLADNWKALLPKPQVQAKSSPTKGFQIDFYIYFYIILPNVFLKLEEDEASRTAAVVFLCEPTTCVVPSASKIIDKILEKQSSPALFEQWCRQLPDEEGGCWKGENILHLFIWNLVPSSTVSICMNQLFLSFVLFVRSPITAPTIYVPKHLAFVVHVVLFHPCFEQKWTHLFHAVIWPA